MTNPPSESKIQRRFIRFPPDPLTVALVDPGPMDQDFTPCIVGLIFQEAYGGCGLILHQDEGGPVSLTKDEVCRIKVGKLQVLKAEVVWMKRIDKDVLKVGFKFLET